MEPDGKGKIYEKEPERKKYEWYFSGSIRHEPSSINYCPHCGSQDLTVRRQITFGNPGYIEDYMCRACGCKF